MALPRCCAIASLYPPACAAYGEQTADEIDRIGGNAEGPPSLQARNEKGISNSARQAEPV